MTGSMHRLVQSRRAATAAEFALVLPIVIMFLLGTIDIGRLMWTWNRAEKATQMGVRYAAVTDMIPSNLITRDFSLNGGIPGGDPVPTGTFSGTTCNDTNCTGSWGYDPTAFGNLVTRVRAFLPDVQATNITVTYDNVGLGYAGDPNGPDVQPLITVTVNGIPFAPLVFQMFGATFTLPPVSASLTMEDGAGTYSN